MRSFWCILVMVSVLSVSLEGAADIVVDGYPHGDETSHQEEFGHSLVAHDGEQSDTELDGEHCDHCCHGHSAGVTNSIASLATPFVAADQKAGRSAHVRKFAQAPPTPPPNA